jgi:hypothetical protein
MLVLLLTRSLTCCLCPGIDVAAYVAYEQLTPHIGCVASDVPYVGPAKSVGL